MCTLCILSGHSPVLSGGYAQRPLLPKICLPPIESIGKILVILGTSTETPLYIHVIINKEKTLRVAANQSIIYTSPASTKISMLFG